MKILGADGKVAGEIKKKPEKEEEAPDHDPMEVRREDGTALFCATRSRMEFIPAQHPVTGQMYFAGVSEHRPACRRDCRHFEPDDQTWGPDGKPLPPGPGRCRLEAS